MAENMKIGKVAIERYLFGEMATAEREAFEEKIFEDDLLFIEVAEAENRLVDKYVAGRLAAADVTRFERSLDLVPARRQKIANARVLGEFIAENRPDVARPEKQQSFMEKVAGLFTFRTPAFGMAAAAMILLMLGVVAVLVVRDRRKDAELARLSDLQTQIDQSRQREEELRASLGSERDAGDDLLEELERERSRREQIERELEQIKQKPPEPPTTPIVASAFLTPLGGRGGKPGTVPTIRVGSNTKRIALRLALPKDVGADELLSVTLNTKVVGSGMRPRASGGGRALAVSLPAARFVKGENSIEVKDEKERNVGTYGVRVEEKP